LNRHVSDSKSSTASLTIRRATEADLPALGVLGASLLRAHYAFDQQRFMAPSGAPEAGYAWFLGTQLKEDDVTIFVAELSGSVVGYVYAGLEPQSWKELREAAGFIHDIVVTPEAQRHGVATALIDAACEWFRSVGAPRVVLWTADKNQGAQRLFTRLGFRRTMIEMTRELERP
jgi:ribosomal protein S18 acetylase RimI-like enzyme